MDQRTKKMGTQIQMSVIKRKSIVPKYSKVTKRIRILFKVAQVTNEDLK